MELKVGLTLFGKFLSFDQIFIVLISSDLLFIDFSHLKQMTKKIEKPIKICRIILLRKLRIAINRNATHSSHSNVYIYLFVIISCATDKYILDETKLDLPKLTGMIGDNGPST